MGPWGDVGSEMTPASEVRQFQGVEPAEGRGPP